jgi:hypothetical protein
MEMAKERRLTKSQTIIPQKPSGVQSQQFLIGTKLRSAVPDMDLLFKTVEQRIEREPSVITWSYISAGKYTTIEVEFIDESTVLRVVVDPFNFAELQSAIETIDNYFIAKAARS